MTNTIYKVNTNFFETPLNKGFQRVLLIEWEQYIDTSGFCVTGLQSPQSSKYLTTTIYG